MNKLLKAGRPSDSQTKLLKQLADQDETMKMNINIKKSFHKDIKRHALEHDITVTELVHQALQDYIKK